MRVFRLTFEIECQLELKDEVIDTVDDEWRSVFYNLETPEDIVDHIARNLIQKRKLSHLDGWADQPNENVVFYLNDWWRVDCEEIMEDKQ